MGSCFALLAIVAATGSAAGPKCTKVGTSGADRLRGGPGADVICARGGDDKIVGGGAADRILGGAGEDELWGGAGRDALLGGAGRDTCRDSVFTVRRGCERWRPEAGKPRRPRDVRWGAEPTYGLPPDHDAPMAIYLSFTDRYVDTSAGDAEMGVFVEAWDESGIGLVSLEIEGPGGIWRRLSLEGGPHLEHTPARLQTSVAVPQTTPAGDYRIASLTIADKKGNGRTLSAAEFRDAGYRSEFAVFHGPDLEGPELTGFALSTTQVDTSQGPAAVVASVGAKDDLSGVNGAILTLRLPSWEPGPGELTGAMGGETPPAHGTRRDGIWDQTLSLPRHAMPGTYRVGGVYLSDLAGNMTHYTPDELDELGFQDEFLQVGPGDTTPPEILDVWFHPPALRTSAGERTISFYIHVRDDLSGFGEWPDTGFSDVWVSFEPPGIWSEFGTTGTVRQLVSGDVLDGVWRHEVTLEGDATPGEYELTYASATDLAGNTTLFNRAAILARGWPDSFYNEP